MNDIFVKSGTVRTAADYGFLPGASADENAAAIQTALDNRGTIFVDIPGVYEISKTLTIGDDASLHFGAGVYLKRALNAQNEQEAGYFIINKGAYDRKFNRNIKIVGLKLICNKLQADKGALIPGLRGQISFFYIKNLLIYDFECLDVEPYSFCIHICTFDNIAVEHARIEGQKDGVHLGCGSKFVIRHCIFKTFDDPVALNAHDYSSANPELGWIENGLIEDCYDLDDEDTTGYFCRMLAGAWVDWFAGMHVQQSDTVISNGRVYRVSMAADGKEYESVTAPSHRNGIEILDGIRWVMVQDRVEYSCGCRNIHFKNIFLQKKRGIAFCLSFEKDKYCRSFYPGAHAPLQQNISLENIVVDNEIAQLVDAKTPFDIISINNSRMKQSGIRLRTLEVPGLEYPKANILISGTAFSSEEGQKMIHCEQGRNVALTIAGNLIGMEDYYMTDSDNVEICGN